MIPLSPWSPHPLPPLREGQNWKKLWNPHIKMQCNSNFWGLPPAIWKKTPWTYNPCACIPWQPVYVRRVKKFWILVGESGKKVFPIGQKIVCSMTNYLFKNYKFCSPLPPQACVLEKGQKFWILVTKSYILKKKKNLILFI